MNNITPQKRCKECGEQFPPTTEYFYAEKRNRSGLQSTCKTCARKKQREQMAQWRRNNPERNKAARKRTYDKRSQSDEYRAKNRARAARWRSEHLEQARATSREYGKSHRKARTVYEKAWRNTHKVQYQRAYTLWASTHRDSIRNAHKRYKHKRRAWLKGSFGVFTIKDIEQHFALQRGRCWWCGVILQKYHIDHRIPLSRGGSNNAGNIVLSCPHCNTSRNDKLPWEWCDRLL